MTRIFFSNLIKPYRITIDSPAVQVRLRLVDLTIGDLEVDYPQISHLILQISQSDLPSSLRDEPVQPRKNYFALPWSAVQNMSWVGSTFQITELHAIQKVDEEIAKTVHLGRDILDAFVIDLQNRRITRANDLLLEHNDGLHLRAADTGIHALLRRIFRGFYRRLNLDQLQDWKYVEFLRGEPGAVQAGAGYRRRITHLPHGEIARLAEGLPYLHAAELVMLLPDQLAADTLELMSAERQLQVFEELDEKYALRILEKVAPDIAADLIGRLTPDTARSLLNRLPKWSSDRVIDLLRYPEDTVGGIMTNDVITLPATITVAESRERLREQLLNPDFVYFVYIMDAEDPPHLKGVVSLRNILVARDDQRLDEIMNPYLETLSPLDSPRKAAYRLINSQIAALPVVSDDGRLLGAVTVDAAVGQVAPQAWRNQAPRVFS